MGQTIVGFEKEQCFNGKSPDASAESTAAIGTDNEANAAATGTDSVVTGDNDGIAATPNGY